MTLKFKCKLCKKDCLEHNGNSNRIYCSNKCKYKGVGEKISQSKLGHLVSQGAREKISQAFKGKTYEEIMGKEKAKIRKEQSKERISGKKNFFWLNKGKLEYDWKVFNLKFKNKIRERDNQVCMNCGIHREKMQRALDVHHINYDEKNTIPENCISLCRNCHGLTATNRKYWMDLLQNKLSKLYGYKYSDKNEVIIEYV